MYALFIIAIIVGAILILQITSISLGQPIMMVVIGDSMLPTLEPYDVIFLEPVDKSNIQIDDIVAMDYSDFSLFSTNNIFVHRVIKTWQDEGESHFQTKGDNNKLPEMGLHGDKALGRVYFHIQYLGFLFGPPANFAIIAAALLVFLASKKQKVS